MGYRNFFKRIFDFFAALMALIILMPFLVVLIIWMHFSNKGAGVFFAQERTGKNARLFTIFKFKTMTDERDNMGKLLPDGARLTRVGKFVRSTSLDELPQLINVLLGDMSLIGPRPLLEKYIPVYSKEQFRRHEVKPGITGWAQVNGRNAITWTQKFELDVYYVDHLSFMLDMQIIWLTILKVILRKDINTANQATTEEFNGKN